MREDDMNNRVQVWVRVAVAAALATGIGATPAAAGDDEPGYSAEMQQEMAMWMKLAQPGTQHEQMQAFEGTWKGEVTMWMAPGVEPMKETSAAEAKIILGGRYLEWTHTGSFAGMPFEGRSIETYSNLDKRYEAIWIDNFGTLILFYTGTASEDGSKREMTTEFSDPMTGGKVAYRTVYQWIDEDHFTYTTFMSKSTGGGEHKNMEIKYTRQ